MRSSSGAMNSTDSMTTSTRSPARPKTSNATSTPSRATVNSRTRSTGSFKQPNPSKAARSPDPAPHPSIRHDDIATARPESGRRSESSLGDRFREIPRVRSHKPGAWRHGAIGTKTTVRETLAYGRSAPQSRPQAVRQHRHVSATDRVAAAECQQHRRGPTHDIGAPLERR